VVRAPRPGFLLEVARSFCKERDQRRPAALRGESARTRSRAKAQCLGRAGSGPRPVPREKPPGGSRPPRRTDRAPPAEPRSAAVAPRRRPWSTNIQPGPRSAIPIGTRPGLAPGTSSFSSGTSGEGVTLAGQLEAAGTSGRLDRAGRRSAPTDTQPQRYSFAARHAGPRPTSGQQIRQVQCPVPRRRGGYEVTTAKWGQSDFGPTGPGARSSAKLRKGAGAGAGSRLFETRALEIGAGTGLFHAQTSCLGGRPPRGPVCTDILARQLLAAAWRAQRRRGWGSKWP